MAEMAINEILGNWALSLLPSVLLTQLKSPYKSIVLQICSMLYDIPFLDVFVDFVAFWPGEQKEFLNLILGNILDFRCFGMVFLDFVRNDAKKWVIIVLKRVVVDDPKVSYIFGKLNIPSNEIFTKYSKTPRNAKFPKVLMEIQAKKIHLHLTLLSLFSDFYDVLLSYFYDPLAL